jgi:FkbM family methyltransferase
MNSLIIATKKTLKVILKKFNLYYYKNNPIAASTMESGISRCISRGLKVNTVIDVGASNGCWSELCMKHLPDAKYLLVEAQEAHRKDLEKFTSAHKSSEVVIAAAGNRLGKIYFDNGGLFAGLASEEPLATNCIEVPVTTIDFEVTQRKLSPPFCIKLDTHGYEVPILEGAKETLKQTNLVIIETYNYKLTKDSLKYYEMNEYMEKLGFSSIEIVDLMRRQKDNSLWQMDTFYIPSVSKEFLSNSYE